MNPADLHTPICTTVPRVIELLSDNDPNICQASISTLSKLVVHGKTGVLCCVIFLTINLADLHTEIGEIMPTIIKLLSHDSSDIRQTSINALSEFVEHGMTSLLCYAIF